MTSAASTVVRDSGATALAEGATLGFAWFIMVGGGHRKTRSKMALLSEVFNL